MKALTVRQPWASLIACGAKTIETRSWRTSYRGWLAIHAGKTIDGIRTLPGDCEGSVEGDWRYGYVGDYQASFCFRSGDEGRRGDAEMVKTDGASSAPDFEGTLPLGAIVATARLVDCLPIVEYDSDDPRPVPDPPLVQRDGHHVWLDTSGPNTWEYDGVNISDQLPYGDFQPGRWAWLLEDVQPTTERCPWCWGSMADPDSDDGWYHHGIREPGSAPPCPVCVSPENGYPTGRCDPIPAKGAQGLWEWRP